MVRPAILVAALSPLLLAPSCGKSTDAPVPQPVASASPSPGTGTGQRPLKPDARYQFTITAYASYNEPWAAAFAPGTTTLFITEKPGTIRFIDTATGRRGTVTGAPPVDYGVQGGLGDIAFLRSEADSEVGERTIYLSWAEAGEGDTRGAVAGRGTLICEEPAACRIEGLNVIWRQLPKVNGRGHYSHRFAFSPDEEYLFISSGERQNPARAQDLTNNLGKVIRLYPDGSLPPDNPFSGQAGKAQDIWSWGHRNLLGLKFDAQGRLWDLEHGPAGGDELNLVNKGGNYGWPLVSEGDQYDGRDIPAHSTRPEFTAPAISWNPVIAPGDFIFYQGDLFAGWKGHALVAGMKRKQLIRVAIEGNKAREVTLYRFTRRLREIVEGPDGAIWLLEDKSGGRLLKLTPR